MTFEKLNIPYGQSVLAGLILYKSRKQKKFYSGCMIYNSQYEWSWLSSSYLSKCYCSGPLEGGGTIYPNGFFFVP